MSPHFVYYKQTGRGIWCREVENRRQTGERRISLAGVIFRRPLDPMGKEEQGVNTRSKTYICQGFSLPVTGGE
jgi:hypothetical protein